MFQTGVVVSANTHPLSGTDTEHSSSTQGPRLWKAPLPSHCGGRMRSGSPHLQEKLAVLGLCLVPTVSQELLRIQSCSWYQLPAPVPLCRLHFSAGHCKCWSLMRVSPGREELLSTALFFTKLKPTEKTSLSSEIVFLIFSFKIPFPL